MGKFYLEVFYNKTELNYNDVYIRKRVLIDLWRKQISIHSMEGLHFICNYLILCFFPDIFFPVQRYYSELLLLLLLLYNICLSHNDTALYVLLLFCFSCYLFHAESVASVQFGSWSSFVRTKSSQQVMLWRRPSQTWQIINKTKKAKKKSNKNRNKEDRQRKKEHCPKNMYCKYDVAAFLRNTIHFLSYETCV